MQTSVNNFHGTNGHALHTIVPFALSLTIHFILFAAIIISPDFKKPVKMLPNVINVSMVNLPEPEKNFKPERKTKKDTTVKTRPAKPEKKEKPSQEQLPDKIKSKQTVPALSKKKIKVKTSLKKKTFKSARVVKSAIKNIEKKVAESRPEALTDVLEQLKAKVIKTEQNKKRTAKTEKKGLSSGKQSLQGKKVAALIDIYRVEVAYQIQENWAFSEQLAGSSTKDLQASLVFNIMPNGEIRDLWFTDRSGNKYLDESAYKAVMKSNPVAPHPVGVYKPFVQIGLRFTPQGVK